MKKILIAIVLSFCTFQISTVLASNEIEEVPDNFARIRIWNTDFRNFEAGHVSLQTKNAYISLWPLLTDTTATHFEVPGNLKNDASGRFVRQAPGFAVNSFTEDLGLENGRSPDHIYYITTNNKRIEDIWNLTKNNLGAPQGNGTRFNSIKWYGPGRGDLETHDVQDNILYFNCASIVMTALEYGGIEKIYLNNCLAKKEIWQGLTQLYLHVEQYSSNPQDEEIHSFLRENHRLVKSIMPHDIKSILDSKIKTELERDLCKNFSEISFIPSVDKEIAYSQMAEILLEKKSQLYRINQPYFRDFISEVGQYTFNNKFFRLSDRVVRAVGDIEEIKRNLTIATLGLAAVGVTFVGVQMAKGNCTVM